MDPQEKKKQYSKNYNDKLKNEEEYCEVCRENVKLISLFKHKLSKKHIKNLNKPSTKKDIENYEFVKNLIEKYGADKISTKDFITEIGMLYEEANEEESKQCEDSKYTEPKTTTKKEKDYCNQTVHIMIMDLELLLDDNSHIPDEMEAELKSIEKTKDEVNSKIRLFNLYKRMNNFLNPVQKQIGEVIEQKIKTIDEPVIKPIIKKVEIVEPVDDYEIDDRDPELACREKDFIPVARFYKLSPEEQERKISDLMNTYDYFLGGYLSNLEDEFESEDCNNCFDMYRRLVHYRNMREEEQVEAIGEQEDDDPFDNGF
jgi:hypothetical protein